MKKDGRVKDKKTGGDQFLRWRRWGEAKSPTWQHGYRRIRGTVKLVRIRKKNGKDQVQVVQPQDLQVLPHPPGSEEDFIFTNNDLVLRPAYHSHDARSRRARAAEHAQTSRRSLQRGDIAANPDQLRRFLLRPGRSDIIGVDSRDAPRRVTSDIVLFHHTRPAGLDAMLADGKLAPQKWVRDQARVKGAGTSDRWWHNKDFSDGGQLAIALAPSVPKRHKVVQIQYDDAWLRAHPEFAARCVGSGKGHAGDIHYMFGDAEGYDYEREEVARRPIPIGPMKNIVVVTSTPAHVAKYSKTTRVVSPHDANGKEKEPEVLAKEIKRAFRRRKPGHYPDG